MGNIFDCSTATKVPTEGDIQEAGEAKTFETNHFDANIDVSENLATILEKGGPKRVLLLIGGDWCAASMMESNGDMRTPKPRLAYRRALTIGGGVHTSWR